MRLSELFTKTRKEVPADETSKNAQLLIRAGFIHKEAAGVYDYLPLGYKILNSIVQIIREEMNAVGGQEVQLTALQAPEIWQASNRWSDEAVDNWFKTKLKSGQEMGLGFTHEEPLTNLMRNFVSSYKDLPRYPYQFQTKFRNELRAKSGIMRCREFLMKDLYSFSHDQAGHDKFYEKMKEAYAKIYERLGLGDITFITFASGGSFSKFSHEFQTITEVGEDTIYVHEGKKIAVNKEVFTPEVLADLGLNKDELVEKKAVEVGNIFTLGTRFSEALGLTYSDEKGENQQVFMGSYGIGPGRVMGVIAEHFADEKGMVWPKNVAPAQVYLISLSGNPEVVREADELYAGLTDHGVEVLYDDRDLRAGEKFADADLMGIPYRVVISDKTLAENKIEVKQRTETDTKLISKDEAINYFTVQ